MSLTLIALEDERAALLCDRAAARLRQDTRGMEQADRLLAALELRGGVAASEVVARAAIDAAREMRGSGEREVQYERKPWMGVCPRCGVALNNLSPGISVIAGGVRVCTPCALPGEEIARAK